MQSLHQKILGELFSVKISCALHQTILGELNSPNPSISDGNLATIGSSLLCDENYLEMKPFLPQKVDVIPDLQS